MRHRMFLIFICCLVILSSVVCTLNTAPDTTQAENLAVTLALLQITQTALAAAPTATTAPSATPAPTEIIAAPDGPTSTPTIHLLPTGSISGKLSFPSEGIPPLRIVAFDTGAGMYYYVNTAQNQSTYRIENLPIGVYHVVAYALDGYNAGGYTQAVPCGLSAACTDHKLVDIAVNPGQEKSGVDPGDWYVPSNTFPPDPLGPVPTSTNALGSIYGKLSFPSEGIPALHIVAFDINTGYHYFTTTSANQSTYQIDGLPAGIYHVVAYTLDSKFAGGYTQAVSCGLLASCTNHSLIDVMVTDSAVVGSINPGDWYAPAGSFPADPVQ